eukprot:COSAG06_NODE_29161_length_561_cov_1.751082_1_plen_91_part_10
MCYSLFDRSALMGRPERFVRPHTRTHHVELGFLRLRMIERVETGRLLQHHRTHKNQVSLRCGGNLPGTGVDCRRGRACEDLSDTRLIRSKA